MPHQTYASDRGSTKRHPPWLAGWQPEHWNGDSLLPCAFRRAFTLPSGRPLTVVCVPFDESEFEAQFFAKAGLPLPPSIARSVPKRQAEFFHGRLAAGLAMLDHGILCTDLPIGPARQPIWPTTVVGSISHSATLAVAAVAPARTCRGIGLDVESVVNDEALLALCSVALDATELAYLERAAGLLSFKELVTLAFSAKESFYKSVYGTVQRFLDFDVVKVTTFDLERKRIELTVAADLHPLIAFGRTYSVGYQQLAPQAVLTMLDTH